MFGKYVKFGLLLFLLEFLLYDKILILKEMGNEYEKNFDSYCTNSTCYFWNIFCAY